MIDFDEIDKWGPVLSRVLALVVPAALRQDLVRAAPKYIDDARDFVLGQADRDAVIDRTLRWIESTEVAGYHGTRLTDADITSVQSVGLVPLIATARRDRIVRALSSHPSWRQVCDRLPQLLELYGPRNAAGIREGQAHLTLSKAGLIRGFNHYLIGGSEFDQQIATELLGRQGLALLASDGTARVIQFAVPGRIAIQAMHPFFTVEMLRTRGDAPNLVAELLAAWSYKQAHPEFQSRSLKIDCGLFFRETVPAEWITAIEDIADSTLARTNDDT